MTNARRPTTRLADVLVAPPGVAGADGQRGDSVYSRRMTQTALITGITGQDGSYLASSWVEEGIA